MKLKDIIPGIILSFLSLCLVAQDQVIVSFSELEYNSDFEQKSFELLEGGETNLLRLFAAIDPDVHEGIFSEFENDLSKSFTSLQTKKFLRTKDTKKAEMLYEFVNERKLKRYQEKILFPHLFVNGTFNCLTASAYYGFLMDSLGIPYEFRESTNHVHPVAFPEDLQIKIETTDRLAGLQYYDEKLRTKFVNYLFEEGIVDREDYYGKTVDELFNFYFFPPSSIGMKELAGLHYMNDALYKFHVSRNAEALVQIKKAFYLYPSDRMLTIFQFILAECLIENDYRDMKDIREFVILSRFPEKRIKEETLVELWLYISELVLITRDNWKLYDQYYYFLEDHLPDGFLRDQISFYYNLIRGRILVTQMNFREGFELVENAFKMNPKNSEAQNLLLSTFVVIFWNAPTLVMMEQLTSYEEEYPAIRENGLFLVIKMNGYLHLAQIYFDLKNEDLALQCIRNFETLQEQHPGIEYDMNLVAEAYSAGGVFYFRKYNNIKARDFLLRGLEYAPDNFELQYRLKGI